MVPQRPAARAFLVTLLDAGLIVAASAALVIVLGGRTRVDVAGVRVTLRTATNAFLFAAGFAALRLWLGRGLPLMPALARPDRFLIEAERERFAHPAPRPPGVAAYAAAAALASILWLMPHLLHPRQVPDPGDPVFSAWRLSQFTHQLVNDPRHLFDGNIFYPVRRALTFSDATVLQGLAAAPFLLLGADPLLVSNALFLLAFPLNALAFFYAGWRLTGDPRAAFITGVLGSLAPVHSEHYSHLELQYTCFIPLAVVALLDLLAAPALRRGAWLGALVTAQWFASMYLGLMLLTFLVPFGAMVALGWRVRPSRAAIGSLAVAGALVAAGFGALAVPYLRGQADREARTLLLAGHFSAMPSEYGRPHRRLVTYRWISREGNRMERELFTGLITPALAAGGAVPPMGAVAMATLASGAIAFDWSLGTYGLTYDDLFHWLRPYQGLRVPARFGMFVTTALVLLASFGCARLIRAASRVRLGTPACLVLAAAALIDLRFEVHLEDYWKSPPAIYGSVMPAMVLAEFPWDNAPDYMYFSTRHRASLLNGYSGSFPEAFIALQKTLEGFPSAHALDALRAAGATHVTYNCKFASSLTRCIYTLSELESSPALERVARDRWEEAEVRLYRFK